MSLRPLPNIGDDAAMSQLGRLSAIRSARLDALHELRDCVTYLMNNTREEEIALARASEAIARLEALREMDTVVSQQAA